MTPRRRITVNSDLKIFAGTANPDLAHAIARSNWSTGTHKNWGSTSTMRFN